MKLSSARSSAFFNASWRWIWSSSCGDVDIEQNTDLVRTSRDSACRLHVNGLMSDIEVNAKHAASRLISITIGMEASAYFKSMVVYGGMVVVPYHTSMVW